MTSWFSFARVLYYILYKLNVTPKRMNNLYDWIEIDLDFWLLTYWTFVFWVISCFVLKTVSVKTLEIKETSINFNHHRIWIKFVMSHGHKFLWTSINQMSRLQMLTMYYCYNIRYTCYLDLIKISLISYRSK